MTLTRTFTPAQFRDQFIGTWGPQTLSVTPTSTTSGGFSKVSGITAAGLQVGDIVFAWLQTPSSGVIVEGQVTAANTLELIFFNISGGTYNPGAISVVVEALRPKTA